MITVEGLRDLDEVQARVGQLQRQFDATAHDLETMRGRIAEFVEQQRSVNNETASAVSALTTAIEQLWEALNGLEGGFGLSAERLHELTVHATDTYAMLLTLSSTLGVRWQGITSSDERQDYLLASLDDEDDEDDDVTAEDDSEDAHDAV